jgi:succinoglycan biosynthesis protein ExoV
VKLYYYESKAGNFGDDINKWLWDELKKDFFDNNPEIRFSSIGTIINKGMPSAKKWIVFSSGIGYGYAPKGFGNESWDIICVRGPLSASILGLPDNKYITDGAALLSTLAEFAPLPETERQGIIFIPHHNALETGKWEIVCARAGIEFVNPTLESKIVIQKIRHAKLVLADAMHAAIISDAMRVPWVPLITSGQINTFKWLDWTRTINLPYKPIVLGASSLKELVRDKLLFLYGEKYFVPELTPDVAINKFKLHRLIKSNFLWPYYFKVSRVLFYKIPMALLSMLGTTLVRNADERFINSAKEKMEEALTSSSYLSSDDIFFENQRKLKESFDDFVVKYTS